MSQARSAGSVPARACEIPAGTLHRFWNESDLDAHATQEFRPALDIASFFESYAALAADGKLKADGMPPLLQLAVMIPAFADEIRVPKPPWPVQQAMARVLGPVARARGYRPKLSQP